MKYRSLNDAKRVTGDAGFGRGKTEVWYLRPESTREFSMGYDWLREQGIAVPSASSIEDTHIQLGKLSEASPDRIFSMMQAESWSPRGEARDLIRDLGLGHTSMMVGDVIKLPSGELLMVDRVGFRSLGGGRRKNPFVKTHKTVSPIVTEGWPELYKYGDWEIEISPWPKDAPVEWMAKAVHHPSGVEEKVFAETGKQEALRAVKISVDMADTAWSGDLEQSAFWDWLRPLAESTAKVEGLTRPNLARRIELARRGLPGAPYTWQQEMEPLFDWFYQQPSDFRVKFLDRAIEHHNLLHGQVAPYGVPAKGRPRPANTNQRVVNTLRHRLLK